ncbi:hypothetical protein M3Y99_00410000 [Aphelenchoides fujianensis]|nr:hypothetical protein M3Y99_00410000 [Aphelenchoides fujianensis]
MKIFDWLCWCDAPHRDESAQYITSDCNGTYAKKPVLCTEQPKPHKEEARTPVKSNGVSTPISKEIDPVGVIKPAESDSFAVPNFPLVESTVRGYRELVARVKGIMNDRQTKLENLLNRPLPNDVDEDNNLATFEKLLSDAKDEPQQIQDLTGFWGLVHKELLDVQRTCGRVEDLRLNNWKSMPRPVTPPPTVPQNRVKTPARTGGPQTPSRTPKANANPNLRAFLAQKRKEMQSNESLSNKVEVAGP